jgi:hypothetical protein
MREYTLANREAVVVIECLRDENRYKAIALVILLNLVHRMGNNEIHW